MPRLAAEYELYDVTDDSGFLALVDPDAYEGFVRADWELDEMFRRFLDQMAAHRLLIWGTGMATTWRVAVRHSGRSRTGFRAVTGSIRCTEGRLLLTSYESLTMAAQFSDATLPQQHERHLVLRLPVGIHRCRVVQLRDPDGPSGASGATDFVLEMERTGRAGPAWKEVPWWDP